MSEATPTAAASPRNLFDLGRRDVLASTTNRILDPAQEPEIAVGVSHREVAGVVPEVAEGFQCCFRAAEIAAKHDVWQLRSSH
jgi:hypothetical protein